MASADEFPSGAEFQAWVSRQVTGDPFAQGYVKFSFQRVDDTGGHTVDTSSIAGALHSLFIAAGYSVEPFTGPVPTQLDLPEEPTNASD